MMPNREQYIYYLTKRNKCNGYNPRDTTTTTNNNNNNNNNNINRCHVNRYSCYNNDKNNNVRGEAGVNCRELQAMLHRIAFTVLHVALHLQKQHGYETPTKHPSKIKQATLTSQPRSTQSVKSSRSRGAHNMDLSYVTERIIALWFPGDISPVAYRQGQQQAATMLHTKHGNNYKVFNLSEPLRAARSHHELVSELGWHPELAPPLERLCTVCKEIASWLSGDSHHIAVIHSRGSKDRIGVVISAYMHYSNICGSPDQALDCFAMRRFLDDKVGDVEQPSHKRYVEYFSGLLSCSIRINSAPLYLTHVTVLGAPAFESSSGPDPSGGCRAFLKVYEGLVPVYTSGVHCVSGGTRQFTVNVAAERQRRGLQLRGDILVKCYHRYHPPPPQESPTRSTTPLSGTSSLLDRPQRELIFACQFHTCAVSDYTLSFTRQQLDSACNDLRFPLDGAVELHFSPTPEVRLPSPAPTPAVPVDNSDDPVTRWDSYENLSLAESPLDGETDEDTVDGDDGEVNHTYGPVDGSLYATISKKQQQQLEAQRAASAASAPREAPAPVIGSSHTASMDSGISSAGNGQKQAVGSHSHSGAPRESNGHPTHLTPEEHHRHLDELLNDMLQTVENIPDLPAPAPSSCSRQQQLQQQGDLHRAASLPRSSAHHQQHHHHTTINNGYGNTTDPRPGLLFEDLDVNFIDAEVDPESIPYHARQDSRPFTYGSVPATSTPQHQPPAPMLKQMPAGLASPSLVRKASFKGGGSTTTTTTTTTLNGGDSYTLRKTQQTASPLTSPPLDFIDSEVLSSPTSDYLNGSSSTSPRSPEFHDGTIIGVTTGSNLTWLQRQQQKLRERREGQLRTDRYPTERRLITELRTIQQHSYNRVLRPSASHRDGYTSDTTHFDDDDEDFTTPLHINTASPTKLNSLGSAPASPLSNRTSSRRNYSTAATTTSHHSYISGSSGTSPLGRHRSEGNFDRERPFVAVKRAHEQNRKFDSLRDESFSSWRTTSTSDDQGSPARSTSPRPQTPAFPVHPRTPYVNNSVSSHFEQAAGGLPPKSPTTQRKDHSPSPLSDHPSTSAGRSDTGMGYSQQQSPKSPTPLQNGQSSPTVYFGHSRRSSVHSNSEPPQEVSPAHVKFVRDTSRFWYKPTISREEAINTLRDQQPGTFVVRDSNSFPGAFGLALKVATPPPSAQGKASDPGSELVRHFLIEPTSRGVRLKGCSNEPVFSSLSALVYQHSLMPMALPCRLVLPESDVTRMDASPGTMSTAQMLLAQGAACNVLYLYTTDMESLTGPQAIKKAVGEMFQTRPLPFATVVHFKVSGQGITLTDNKRQLFFRRHYPTNTISHCGLDPDDHRWSQKSDETGMPISSNRVFGFVARKLASKTDNQCHIFAELEPEQPASAIVNFVCKVMMSGGVAKSNIV